MKVKAQSSHHIYSFFGETSRSEVKQRVHATANAHRQIRGQKDG